MRITVEKYYSLIAVALLCLFYIYKAVDSPVHDFANYYFGGYFLSENQFVSNIYFPHWFNTQIVSLGYEPLFAGFAPNTPFLALLFCPLTLLSLGAAKVVFNLISVTLFIYSLGRLVTFYSINAAYVLAIPVLFFVPIKNEILFGQVYLLLFFFLAESWLAYEKNQLKKSAVFLSMAVLLKVFPLLLIVYFLIKRQFSVFFYTIISCLILVLLTMIFCGFDIWIFYIQNVLSKAFNGGIASAYIVNYQSVFMFFKEMLVYDVTENPGAFVNQPQLFVALMVAFKFALVCIGCYVTRNIVNPLLVFSYWIICIIIISPYGSTYTFILLLFPYFVLLKCDLSNARKGVFLILLLLINNFPLSLFMGNPFPFSYLRVFALILFFMLFLSVIYKCVNWKMIGSISLASLIAILVVTKKDTVNSSYFLDKESPLLIYDYKISNNRLTYFYWDHHGENTKILSYEISNADSIPLKNNQIYYQNKQITFDNGNKLKPVLVNHNTILFLSDYDRGIGFYTLRKIHVN